MKPKTIVDADAYDHFRSNDDINNRFNKQTLDTSYKSDISTFRGERIIMDDCHFLQVVKIMVRLKKHFDSV